MPHAKKQLARARSTQTSQITDLLNLIDRSKLGFLEHVAVAVHELLGVLHQRFVRFLRSRDDLQLVTLVVLPQDTSVKVASDENATGVVLLKLVELLQS